MILSSEFNCGVMKPVWHSHTFCELIYLNKGEAVFSFEQSRIRIREHQMILITALEPHSVESNRPEYERFCLRLSPRDVMDALANPLLSCVFASRQKNAFFVFDASDDPLLFQSIFRHLDTVFHQKNELSDYEIRAGLQTLFSAAFRRQEKVFFDAYTENPELRKAMDFLNRHYAEAIRIDEVAKSFFWSPAYFSHAFKQFSGYSPKTHLPG